MDASVQTHVTSKMSTRFRTSACLALMTANLMHSSVINQMQYTDPSLCMDYIVQNCTTKSSGRVHGAPKLILCCALCCPVPKIGNGLYLPSHCVQFCRLATSPRIKCEELKLQVRGRVYKLRPEDTRDVARFNAVWGRELDVRGATVHMESKAYSDMVSSLLIHLWLV